MNFSPQKIAKLYSLDSQNLIDPEYIINLMNTHQIPTFPKGKNGVKKSWTTYQLPEIGKKLGFIKPLPQCLVICSFVTKGGVLKTSITLNLARIAAINNIKTCVVGLDMQGDITSALGFNNGIEDSEDLETAIKKLSSIRGLPDYFNKTSSWSSLIQKTDLPNLDFIPETPELVNLERSLNLIHQREYWLKKNLISDLKPHYDLILLDASPNWNQLITNALVCSDILISPLECKINNFRNFKMFDSFIKEFKRDLNLNFSHLYVPTRWQKQRKLSTDILEWYQKNTDNCSAYSIPESTTGEEASALNISVNELEPDSLVSLQYSQLIKSIFEQAQIKMYKNKSNFISKNSTTEINNDCQT
jgi:chromosome partitioning protein